MQVMGRDSLRFELREAMAGLHDVTGALLATTDGLVLAAECDEQLAEPVAALAAATAGVGAQFTQLVGIGDTGTYLVQGGHGCVAVQRVAENTVLVLYGRSGANVAWLNLAVRQIVPRIEAVLKG
ncbi:MAG TPA: roadblock/LC7 domain-containing protein [Pseudonocardia sp.]|nr:roadblock/LC7 domain-containing protein [Pseudonocardia sp.]